MKKVHNSLSRAAGFALCTLIVDFSHASALEFTRAVVELQQLFTGEDEKLTSLRNQIDKAVGAFRDASHKFDGLTKDSGLQNAWVEQLKVVDAKDSLIKSVLGAEASVPGVDGPAKFKVAMAKVREESDKYVGRSARFLNAGVFLIQNVAPITIPASLVAGIGGLCVAHFAAPKDQDVRAAWAIGLSAVSLAASGSMWYLNPMFYQKISTWIATTSYMQGCVAFAGVATPIAAMYGLCKWVGNGAAKNARDQGARDAHSPQDTVLSKSNTRKDSWLAKFPIGGHFVEGGQVPSDLWGYTYSGGIALALISLLAAGAIYLEFTDIMDVMYPGIAGAVGLCAGAIGFTQLEWTSDAAQETKAKK
jgi:hypothetical protein